MFTEKEVQLQDNILNVLLNNGIVIMPCDTIYGIVGISPFTENKIRELKGRKETNPFLILIKKKWISRYTRTGIDKYFLDLWPAALTLIVPGLQGVPVALRVPDDERLQNILSRLNQPLFSTSVNKTGESALNRSQEIEKEFSRKVDLFVNEGDLKGGIPSTIVDLSQKPYKLVRQGPCKIASDILR